MLLGSIVMQKGEQSGTTTLDEPVKPMFLLSILLESELWCR